MKFKILVLLAMAASVIAATPANADHDQVYAPCDPEDTRPLDEQVWYIDYQSGDILRYDDPWWTERPGTYTNWRHQCLLGMSGVWQAAPILPMDHPPDYEVETRQTKSPCINELYATVERLITDGSISSQHTIVNDRGVFLDHTSPVPLVETGVVEEWALGHDGSGHHYTDLYWEYRFDGVSNWSFWAINCTTVPSPSPTTTTTTTTQPAVEDPAPETTPPVQLEEPDPSPQPPPESQLEPEQTTPIPPDPPNVPDNIDDYDLFDAEWDGYPFEQTILLLEERYPPGTPNKHHFRLSTAIEFLRTGGMIKGLDNLWDSPA
jgi:hypothetical protein